MIRIMLRHPWNANSGYRVICFTRPGKPAVPLTDTLFDTANDAVSWLIENGHTVPENVHELKVGRDGQ